MSRASLLIACLLLASCAPTPAAHDTTPDAPRAPIALFNGSDLAGWEQRGGKAVYRVENGCIVGETRPNQPNSFLCTTSEYDDFILELDFKIDDGANSGIQIRSESRLDYQNGRVHGYQVEIDPSDRAWTGGIYDEARRGWLAPLDKNPEARAAFRHNDWNQLRIVADGDHIQTWLNGVPAADLHDSLTRRGFVALQVHAVGDRAEPLRVSWRDIRLQPVTHE